MKFNLPSCKERYADIARALKINTAHMTPDQAANAAITYIEQLAERIHIPKLSETAFKPSDVLTLSLHALEDTGMPEESKRSNHCRCTESVHGRILRKINGKSKKMQEAKSEQT